MMEICQATQIQHEQIRAAAYECLVRVAALYYEKLPPYMQSLFNVIQYLHILSISCTPFQ